MTKTFLDRLVAGHFITRATKAEALDFLQKHSLLMPTYSYSGTVAMLREFCAALLWVDGPASSLSAAKQLSPDERTTLCKVFGLPVLPAAVAAQSARIMHYVATKKTANAAAASSRARASMQAAGGAAAGSGSATAAGGASTAPAGAGGGGVASAAGLAQASGALVQSTTQAGSAGNSMTSSASGTGGASVSAAAATAAAATTSAATAAGTTAVAAAGGGVQLGGGGQAGAVLGSGGVAPSPLPADLVTPAQLALVAAMDPTIARQLVRAAQMPLLATDSDDEVRRKLLVAVWAAEAPRVAADLRSLPDHAKLPAMTALGLDPTWAVALQDSFMLTMFQLCRSAPWVANPSQSHGLLTADRLASLAFMAQLCSPGAGAVDSRARLAATLSAVEFQMLDASLHRAGRSFADVTWCGSTWGLSVTGGGTSAASSVGGSSGASTVGGSSSAGSGPMIGTGLGAASGLGQLVGHVTESLEEAERQLDSLRVDTFALMSSEETKQNAARVKAASASPGRKRERAHPGAQGSDDLDELHPLASFPWNQRVVAVESESLALLGRKLRILLTWCNEQFKDELSCTTHSRLQDEQGRLYSTLLTTMDSKPGSALIMVPRVLTYARNRMASIVQNADRRAFMYPLSPYFQYVAAQRALQKAQLDPFLAAVEKRISARVEHLEASLATQITLLMWREFLSGWLPPAYSASLCSELQAQSAQLEQQAGSSVGTGSVAGSGSGIDGGGGAFAAGSSSGADGGGGPSGGGSGGTPTGGHGSKVCEFRKHIPPSIDIVGDKLGVPCPTVCHQCKPSGRHHYAGECPKRWQKGGLVMPGFRSDGTRDPAGWRKDSEPIKATMLAWVALLKDHSNWNGVAPIQVGVAGAPSLSDYEQYAKVAPDRP